MNCSNGSANRRGYGRSGREKKRDLEDQLRTCSVVAAHRRKRNTQICRRDIDSLNQRFTAENKSIALLVIIYREHKKTGVINVGA